MSKRQRYERLCRLCLRLSAYLTGPAGRLLPERDWEELFQQYQARLRELRALGEELRPMSLRSEDRELVRQGLVAEIEALFAGEEAQP